MLNHSLYAQKKIPTRQQTKVVSLCSTCCECSNLKKESEAYQEKGCSSIEELCKSTAKSGTGPVVVGGSRNEHSSRDCFCEENNLIVPGRATSIVASLKGTNNKAPIKVLVEIFDRNQKKVFSSKQSEFNVFLMAYGSIRNINKIPSFILNAKQAALVQVPIRLKTGILKGNALAVVTFYTEHPKTKKRKIVKKVKQAIKIASEAKARQN